MIRFLLKIFFTPKKTIPIGALDCSQADVIAVGNKIQKKIKRLFLGSLAIREVDAGSDNSVEQELVALSNAFYDVERFGIHFVASPKHADMLMVTGPMTRNMAEATRRAYEATPDPKIVVAVGDDAIDGGIYKGSYAVLDGAQAVIPVDYQIPGDPPTPQAILCHLLKILEIMESKTLHQK